MTGPFYLLAAYIMEWEAVAARWARDDHALLQPAAPCWALPVVYAVNLLKQKVAKKELELCGPPSAAAFARSQPGANGFRPCMPRAGSASPPAIARHSARSWPAVARQHWRRRAVLSLWMRLKGHRTLGKRSKRLRVQGGDGMVMIVLAGTNEYMRIDLHHALGYALHIAIS